MLSLQEWIIRDQQKSNIKTTYKIVNKQEVLINNIAVPDVDNPPQAIRPYLTYKVKESKTFILSINVALCKMEVYIVKSIYDTPRPKQTYSPEQKARKIAQQIVYRKRPEVQARIKAYSQKYWQRPEVQARRKEYEQSPEVKARRNQYQKKYNKKNQEKYNAYQKAYRKKQHLTKVSSN